MSQEAFKSSANYNISEVHTGRDSEEVRLATGEYHETVQQYQHGESEVIVGQIAIEGDMSLRVGEIINCFKKTAGLRLRGSTPYTYERIFRLFASAMQIEKLTKRQLAGAKGKEALLNYLLDEEKVSLASRRLYNAGLKLVWETGIGLSYPINSRRDLGELPPVQRRQSPRDADLLPLVKAIDHEAEPYLKTLVLIVLQTGIRPSHARLFRWLNVRYGPDGKPDAILTTGLEKGNKHYTPVKIRLPPDLSEALVELRRSIPDARPEDPILPQRKRNGEYLTALSMTLSQYQDQWLRFEKRHRLNHIAPVYLRHWVSTICRRAGLSYAATNAMQGHKCASMNMRDKYDCPDDEEIFVEQARVLPHGPIGVAWPKMEVTEAVPVELTEALSKCLSGQILPSQIPEIINAYLLREMRRPSTTIIT